MENKFINTDKKGTVILTHYRSGGTQLRHILKTFLKVHSIPSENYGEVSLDLEDSNFYDEIYNLFFNSSQTKYRIIQLNNPLVISFLYQSSLFSNLKEQYHVVYLERKDHAKCLLSLPLWEKFIKEGYNDLEDWDEKTMNTFHNKYINNPIKYSHLYTGLHSEYNPRDGIAYTNYIVMTFVNILAKNRSIATTLNVDCFEYEDYEEYNEEFFTSNFNTHNSKFLNQVKDTYLQKIPYVSSNYVDYFDKSVKEVLANWGI